MTPDWFLECEKALLRIFIAVADGRIGPNDRRVSRFRKEIYLNLFIRKPQCALDALCWQTDALYSVRMLPNQAHIILPTTDKPLASPRIARLSASRASIEAPQTQFEQKSFLLHWRFHALTNNGFFVCVFVCSFGCDVVAVCSSLCVSVEGDEFRMLGCLKMLSKNGIADNLRSSDMLSHSTMRHVSSVSCCWAGWYC